MPAGGRRRDYSRRARGLARAVRCTGTVHSSSQWFPRLLAIAGLGAILVTAAQPVAAQDPSSPPTDTQVVDATDKTDVGLVQVELGASLEEMADGSRTSATPFTIRYGVSDWLEASVGADGVVTQRDSQQRASGFGNVQIGAKLRVFGAPGGAPVLGLLPQVTLPTADASQGLGSGVPDVVLGFVSGKDLPHRAHVDVSYGIGAIGVGEHQGHLAQHTATVGASAALTSYWTPVLGAAWISRQDATTGHAFSLTAESAFAASQRVAFDISSQFGLSAEAPAFEVSGGISVLVGELEPDQQGVRARRHRLLWHPKRRAPGRR